MQHNTENKIIFEMLDLLRSSAFAPRESFHELALLLSVVRTVEAGTITAAQDLPNAYKLAGDKLTRSVELLESSQLYKQVPTQVLDKVIALANQTLDCNALTLLKVLTNTARKTPYSIDSELASWSLAELMCKLVNVEGEYVLVHNSSISCAGFLRHPEKATLQVPRETALTIAAKVLLGIHVEVKSQEELFTAQSITTSSVISTPPLGMKLSFESAYKNSEEAALAQLADQLVNKGVILVAGHVLSGRSSAHIRESLLQKNLLEAVIQLPKGALSFTTIPPVLLLLNKDRAENAPVQFYQLESLAEQQWLAISDKVNNREPGSLGVCVSRNEIRQQGFDLSVQRYDLGPATALLEQMQGTVNLGGIAQIIRAQSIASTDAEPDDTEAIFEITSGDIDESGHVNTPQKCVLPDEKNMRRVNSQRVMPGDILLSIKGIIGKIAFIDQSCPENWVAGQAFVIIRPQKNIGTEYLYSYLASDLVQAYLNEMSSGSAMKVMKAADIDNIPVPLPSAEAQKSIMQIHEKIQSEYSAIEEHRSTIQGLRSTLWPLPEQS